LEESFFIGAGAARRDESEVVAAWSVNHGPVFPFD
jgi:hypothetical protein